MSGVFSIASHSVLQYLPEVVRHEQTGWAHLSAFAEAISFLQSSNQERTIQALTVATSRMCFCTEMNTRRNWSHATEDGNQLAPPVAVLLLTAMVERECGSDGLCGGRTRSCLELNRTPIGDEKCTVIAQRDLQDELEFNRGRGALGTTVQY